MSLPSLGNLKFTITSSSDCGLYSTRVIHSEHCYSSVAASPVQQLSEARRTNPAELRLEETKDRIKKLFKHVDLSVSSYDTAWVATVPSLDSSRDPLFPQCLNWLLENQLSDGSWGVSDHRKDALLSTLASVVALKRWGVGRDQINKGILFIENNLASAVDENQGSPIGFEVIFPTMIERSNDLGLNFFMEPSIFNAIVQKKETELKRIDPDGNRAFLAYISEGIGKPLDWENIMKYQRKNGSLFNSPATTAFALTNLRNDDFLKYLFCVLDKFGNAVPAVYPLDIYARLSMVDSLQRLGISRHFKEEIGTVLDETYGFWLQGDESLFLDASTCAMAFRLLRVNGYDVSSDPLARFSEDHIVNYLGRNMKDFLAILEVFRASEVLIHPGDSVLEKQKVWASGFLNDQLSGISTDNHIIQEVNEAFKLPYHASLERLSSRRAIEHYTADKTKMLKTSYRSLNLGNKDFLELAVEDFNNCQSIHQEELKNLTRWVVENRLDKLKFARQKLAYCYFSAAATLSAPELSEARISWAKNGVLTTVVDDFFDIFGSEEEMSNLIDLVEKWDINVAEDCCSEQVEIIFTALQSTISEMSTRAHVCQGRSVTEHIIEIWLDLLKSMVKEARWLKYKTVPTMDEYMKNAHVSFALGPIVLPTLYLVGPKLSESLKGHPELLRLYELMSSSGRLLNDIQGFKRETDEGKLNAVSLSMIHGSDGVTEEEVMRELKGLACDMRRQLLRNVLEGKDSVIPRACRDLFWNMSQVLNLFYAKDDGFTSNEMIGVVKGIIEEAVLRSDI